ncbi:MAG: type II toxin-antitoxin system YafQ family toxin [Lachnospiraceae bacterium]|nr:type II toxin-antitoxin system YafQ family toxin [Lachnospiraceae bacterium]
MLKIRYHTSFKKDYKRIVKRGYDIKLMEEIIQKLAKGEQLPEKNKDHSLSGEYTGCRECHITPDWLLIYETDNGGFEMAYEVDKKIWDCDVISANCAGSSLGAI